LIFYVRLSKHKKNKKRILLKSFLIKCVFSGNFSSLQEERRRAAAAANQETPFGIYGPPTPYTPGYF
jgi:hypothetical protein